MQSLAVERHRIHRNRLDRRCQPGCEVERLCFAPDTEAEFQSYFIQRSLPRARWATAIYLALVVVVTAINMRGTMTPFAESILQPIYLLRLGVACPALVLILAATMIPELHRHYQWIAAACRRSSRE